VTDQKKDPLVTEPPFLSYTALGERKPEPEKKEPSETSRKLAPYLQGANKAFTVFTWVILGVVLAIWAVVGAVFWIPLLIRALFRFSISLIEAMFEGHKPARAARILRDAVGFYRRGFVVAVEMVTGEQIRDEDEGPVMENRLVLEILWAALVWYFLALLFGWIQASPLDLVDWFRSIPWGQYFGDLADRFRS